MSSCINGLLRWGVCSNGAFSLQSLCNVLFVISLYFIWSFTLSSQFCLRVRAAVTWVTPAVTAVLMLFWTSSQTCVTALYWSFLPPRHLFPMSMRRPVPSHNPSVHRAASITHTIQCKAIIIIITITIICKSLRYWQSQIYPPKTVVNAITYIHY